MSTYISLAISLAAFFKPSHAVGDAVRSLELHLNRSSSDISLRGFPLDFIFSVDIFWGETGYRCHPRCDDDDDDDGQCVLDVAFDCQSYRVEADEASPYHLVFSDGLFLFGQFDLQIHITSLTITDNEGATYTVDTFCLPPMMECSLDKVVPDIMKGSTCNQWPSKTSYSMISMGSGTNLDLLYVDLKIFGERFADTVVEGGVRPPKIVSAGIINGDDVQQDIEISVQWDNQLYHCQITEPGAIHSDSSCELDATQLCPGIRSRFYLSVYANDQIASNGYAAQSVVGVFVEDEIGNIYRFDGPLCRAHTPYTAEDNSEILCSDEGKAGTHRIYDDVLMAHRIDSFADLVPFFMPKCLFEFANTDNSELEIEVGAGDKNPIDRQCWDPADSDCFGGDIQPQCPETPIPTSDPTKVPTPEPTSSPTSPTLDPTLSPTLRPTDDPTIDPTTSPTIDPTDDPTAYPTPVPTLAPSTSSPTHTPIHKQIGKGLKTFELFRDDSLNTAGKTDFEVNIFWNDIKYDCSVRPVSICSHCTFHVSHCFNSSIPSNTDNPYYVQFKWQSKSALGITKIIITDNEDSTYTVDTFCTPPLMECSFDKLLPEKMKGSSCNQWPSKTGYSEIVMGGSTNLKLLYVDFEIFGDRFGDTVIEGGVRPPNVVSAGTVTGHNAAEGAKLSVQWDTTIYQCTLNGPERDSDSICSVASSTASELCPGIQSRFYLSVFVGEESGLISHIVDGVIIEDETGNVYRLDGRRCRRKKDDGSKHFAIRAGQCSEPGLYDTLVFVSTLLEDRQNLIPIFMPRCLFDYANTDNSDIEIEVGTDYPEQCWDPRNPNCYGGDIDLVCPATPIPTSDPTIDPTVDPTADPTFDPTSDPTSDPTADPTLSPTPAPTTAPTSSPTSNPTADPTFSPTANPTAKPTHIPTADPTSTSEPSTQSPTSVPTAEPTMEPTMEPTQMECHGTSDEFMMSSIDSAEQDNIEQCELCVCLDNEYECYKIIESDAQNQTLLDFETQSLIMAICDGRFEDCEIENIRPVEESFDCGCSGFVC